MQPFYIFRFLILGSALGNLMHQTSESLAGRMERIATGGFSMPELGAKNEQQLWLKGGLPLSFWAESDVNSIAFN